MPKPEEWFWEIDPLNENITLRDSGNNIKAEINKFSTDTWRAVFSVDSTHFSVELKGGYDPNEAIMMASTWMYNMCELSANQFIRFAERIPDIQ